MSNGKDLIANRYHIEKKINKSERGTTYLVSDTKNNNELKCLKTIGFSTKNKTDVKEIISEENILSRLDNPYIVKYHESFLHNETICIITEYCSGGDLAQKIKEFKRQGEKFSEDRIVYWFSQLLSACYYLHSNKILHRNIKPGNIYLKNGNIKLGDFGISRILEEMDDASTFIGTPYYMSPEVVQNQKYNKISDVWSIGCVLYELASFQRPFIGDGIFDIFTSIVNDEAPSIQNLYSKDLNRILKKILSKDPHTRPSIRELLEEEYISDYVKQFIQKSLENSHTPERIAALINSVAAIGEGVLDDEFGEFDDKSTLRSQPKGTLLSSGNSFERA